MVFSVNCEVFVTFVVLPFAYADLNKMIVSGQNESHYFITVQYYFSKTKYFTTTVFIYICIYRFHFNNSAGFNYFMCFV